MSTKLRKRTILHYWQEILDFIYACSYEQKNVGPNLHEKTTPYDFGNIIF